MKPTTKEKIQVKIGLSSRVEQCFLPCGRLSHLPHGLLHTTGRSIGIGDRVVQAAETNVANLKELMSVISNAQAKGELWLNVTFEKVGHTVINVSNAKMRTVDSVAS